MAETGKVVRILKSEGISVPVISINLAKNA